MELYVVKDGEAKKANLWEKTKTKVSDIWQAAKDNKEALLVAAPVVIGVVTTITKVVGRNINLHKVETMQTKRVWDPHLGTYWDLNRKMNNTIRSQLNDRMAKGENMGDILSNMGVLK